MSSLVEIPLNNKWSEKSYLLAVLVLSLSFIYIISLVMNPKFSWVQPETFYYKSYIMKDMPLSKIIKGTFNSQVFEYSDRITRPLSSMFDIVDTHFRSWIWQYITPIASLSLTFIFSLILGPLLFLRLLDNIGVRPTIALFATAIMLLNPGSLSLVVMLFRPAKAMMNFWLIFGLYFASLIYLHDNGIKYSYKVFPCFFLVAMGILFGFLFDETAVVIVTAILFLFPSVFLRNYRRMLGFALVPLLLLVLYVIIFPDISVYYGYPKPNLMHYSPLGSGFPPIKILLSNLINNTKDITFESLGLFNPIAAIEFKQKIIFSLLILASAIFLSRLFLLEPKNLSPVINSFIYKTVFLIFALCVFHTLLMDTVGNKIHGRVWGPYWYAAYFGIFWAILLALLGELSARVIGRISYSYVVLMSLMALALMTAFPATNFLYRDYHFYPFHPQDIESLYRGNLNRFALYNKHVFGGKAALTDVWHTLHKGIVPTSIRKEYYWIPLEMGLLNNYPILSLEIISFTTTMDYPLVVKT